MADENRDEFRLVKNDVTVWRTVKTERFEHIAVAYNIQSHRDHRTQIRVFEDIPSDIGIENIGFHPQYLGNHWEIDRSQVIFDRWFEPGETINTIYAALEVEPEEALRHLTDPPVDIVLVAKEEYPLKERAEDGQSDGENALAGRKQTASSPEASRSEADTLDLKNEEFLTQLGKTIHQVESEDSPSQSPSKEEPTSSIMSNSNDSPRPNDDATAADPNSNDDAPKTTSPEEDGQDEESAVDPIADQQPSELSQGKGKSHGELDTSQIVTTLAEELRQDQVAAEDRKLIQEWLSTTEPHSEVRIQHLQQRISDIEAYTDSLETFIDENGTGRKLINNLKTSIQTLEEDIDRIDSRLDSSIEVLNEITDEVTDLSDSVDEIDGDIEQLSAEISELETETDSLEDDLGQLEVLENRVGSIAEDIEDIHDHLETLDTFRNRLLSVLEAESD